MSPPGGGRIVKSAKEERYYRIPKLSVVEVRRRKCFDESTECIHSLIKETILCTERVLIEVSQTSNNDQGVGQRTLARRTLLEVAGRRNRQAVFLTAGDIEKSRNREVGVDVGPRQDFLSTPPHLIKNELYVSMLVEFISAQALIWAAL